MEALINFTSKYLTIQDLQKIINKKDEVMWECFKQIMN